MKKLVVILLFLQIFSNNIFAEELIRMPRLFTHYYHHATEHKDIQNFWDFIHKHYSDHHKGDKHSHGHDDEDNDCNLPFKHCDDCCTNSHTTTIGSIPESINSTNIILSFQKTTFYPSNDRIESFDMHTIWQPPKLS